MIFTLLQIAKERFLINISPSIPLGLYRIEKLDKGSIKILQHGDIVALCLMPKVEEQGLQRRYILPGLKCRKSNPLIKTIFAVPGDNISLAMEKITLNGKNFPFRTLKYDSQNRSLDIYPRGAYKHTSNYWVIGSHVANSWDSRYWGPIEPQQILFRLSPIFLFEKIT